MNTEVYQLYLELLEKHGSPQKFWPQWCARKKTLATKEKIAIGAILTQRTSWHNAHLALLNLKKENLLSLQKILGLTDFSQLVDLIRPAGFYQTKPKRLFNFCSFAIKEYGGLEKFMAENLEVARDKLLSIPGIGPETADTILLYVLDKPSFVVDEYTKRLVKRRGLTDNLNSDSLKNLFEENLPGNVGVYQDFHALIIIDQKGEVGSRMEKI